MVIVHVLTRLLRAGAEENTLEVCRAQQADGHHVILVHGRDFDPQMGATAAKTLQVERIESLLHAISPPEDIRAVIELRRLFERLQPDVVHTHQSKAGTLGRIAAALAGVRIIIHGVHILPWVQIRRSKRWIYIAAERICALFTTVFIDVSPSVKAECLAKKIGRLDQHFVAFSPMPVARFRGAVWPDDWSEILGVRDRAFKPPVVLMLAAFEPRKRQAEYIQALAAAACPANTLVLFGGVGPTMDKVKAQVAALGWGGRVRFLGHRTDPEKLIALADVCALSSAREGLPRVVVQYAAGGRPIVTTRVPGLEDIVGDGENAIIAEDVVSAAQATARLLRNPELRERLAAGAAATDVDQWSIERIYPTVRAAYAEADGRTRRRGMMRTVRKGRLANPSLKP